MAVNPKTLEVCKCYVTQNNQVRHIIELQDGILIYESRGRRYRPFPWDRQPPVNKNRFAEDVNHEVPCNFDPDFSQDQTSRDPACGQ
jgi:hypothetical protein